MAEKNQEVTYIIDKDSENNQDYFVIPIQVRQTLGIADDENSSLKLSISEYETGDVILDEVIVYNLTAGPEIVEPKTRAVIDAHQKIRVTVSRVE